MVDCFRILSMNCQGLGDKNKRKDVFAYLRKLSYSIYCLQDTHFTVELEKNIRAEWGYNCFFSCWKSNARGVAILFNNNFEYKVLKEKSDNNGNFLALDLEIHENKERLSLITLYAPNGDEPLFFDKITEAINEFSNKQCIICGDFNLVINPILDYDKTYKQINNKKARDRVLEIMENYNLIDVYRQYNPEKRRYTWRRKNPIKQARLDFFLISENLLSSIEKSNIESGYRSDHAIIDLSLKFNDFQKRDRFMEV